MTNIDTKNTKFANEYREKEKIQDIIDELEKFKEYILNKNNATVKACRKEKSRMKDKDKPAPYQIADTLISIYEEGYKNGKKTSEIIPNYNDFKKLYEDYEDDSGTEKNGQSKNNQKEKKYGSELVQLINTAFNRFRSHVDSYYSSIDQYTKKLVFVQCAGKTKGTKKILCLDIVYKNRIDFKDSEKVLSTFRKKPALFYYYIAGAGAFIIAMLSITMGIGLIRVIFTHKYFLEKYRAEILITLVVIIIIASFSWAFIKDIDVFDRIGKRVISNSTKLMFYPYILLTSLFKGKFINIFQKNLVAYKQDNNIIVSRIDIHCPICKTIDKLSLLILKNRKEDVVFECENENLHCFTFDKVKKIGNLLEK